MVRCLAVGLGHPRNVGWVGGTTEDAGELPEGREMARGQHREQDLWIWALQRLDEVTGCMCGSFCQLESGHGAVMRKKF
jgi:hypothetical protein